MSDFRYHGSYPNEHSTTGCRWNNVCQISVNIAFAFYNDALLRQRKPMADAEKFGQYLNKCFTAVQDTFSSVIAIYKHDSKWWLIEADKIEFLKAWEKRSGVGDKPEKPYDYFDYRGDS